MNIPYIIEFMVENNNPTIENVSLLCVSKATMDNFGFPKNVLIQFKIPNGSYHEILNSISKKDKQISGVRTVLYDGRTSIKDFHNTKVLFNCEKKSKHKIKEGIKISSSVSDLFFENKITKDSSIDFVMPAGAKFHIVVFCKN